MSKTIKKWQALYHENESTMSELLRTSKNELTKEQVKELLSWAGENDVYTEDYISGLVLRKPVIIAVDFDGTLFVGAEYPLIGTPNYALIQFLKERKEEGDKIILWTCRSGHYLKTAVKNANQHGLYFDAINENIPENIEEYGNNCRKVYADFYIDDHNFSSSFANALFSAGEDVKKVLEECPGDYNQLLSDKMDAEYKHLIKTLSLLPADNVIAEHAYEIVIKREIISCYEDIELVDEEAQALYQLENSLDAIYQDWLKNDFSYADMIRDTIMESGKQASGETVEVRLSV